MRKGYFNTQHIINGERVIKLVKGYVTKIDGCMIGVYNHAGKWFAVDLNTGLAMHVGSYTRLGDVKKCLGRMTTAFKAYVADNKVRYNELATIFEVETKCIVYETSLSERVDLE